MLAGFRVHPQEEEEDAGHGHPLQWMMKCPVEPEDVKRHRHRKSDGFSFQPTAMKRHEARCELMDVERNDTFMKEKEQYSTYCEYFDQRKKQTFSIDDTDAYNITTIAIKISR